MNIITDTSVLTAQKVFTNLADATNISIEPVLLQKTIGKTANAVVLTGLYNVERTCIYTDANDNEKEFNLDNLVGQPVGNNAAVSTEIPTPKTLTNVLKLKFNLYVNTNDVRVPSNICRYRLDITSDDFYGISLFLEKQRNYNITIMNASALEGPASEPTGYSHDQLSLVKRVEWSGNSSAVSGNSSNFWILLPGKQYYAVIWVSRGSSTASIMMGVVDSSSLFGENIINVTESEILDQDGLFLSDSLISIAGTVSDLEDQIADIPDEIQDAISTTTDMLAQQYVSR